MGRLEFYPHAVRRWGHAAQSAGHDVGTAKRKVAVAGKDAGQAQLAQTALGGASDRYTSAIESAVSSVASALTGTGDQLLTTVAVVTSTDDKSSDLFRAPTGLYANRPHWYGVDGGIGP